VNASFIEVTNSSALRTSSMRSTVNRPPKLGRPPDAAVLAALGLPQVQYKQVGGYLLGRRGVSAAHQGRGYGELLVERAIAAAQTARQTTGGAYLAVDPKNDRLLAWYLGLEFGFVRLDPRHRRIVLKL
jgi:ribosomal protein S18 acetylase RimI-like enzyme